ncbi:MAG: DUF5320 domain-containing protein [Nanoarchaeota archaeon]|nr:DUF5320 domain-containing protein [Nanoarchaeota archaeon]MBU0962939.1 DUF5320 domain-containing protein [Nanoarchaeota archaeon]
MAGQDGTGPAGQSSMTGRGLGPCGCGMRRGFSRGFGFRRQIILTKEEEKKILEAEIEEIELEKQEIEKRLKEIK